MREKGQKRRGRDGKEELSKAGDEEILGEVMREERKVLNS